MTTRLVIVGAGGFGRETLDVIEAINASGGAQGFELLGIVDDNPNAGNLRRAAARGVPHLGSVDSWLSNITEAKYLLAVGEPHTRRRLVEKFEAANQIPATVVHPDAVIGSVVSIAAGSVVCSGVQVSTNVHVGRHVHLNAGAIIGHDAVLQDFVSVNPGATISGGCQIGEAALIGAASVILQGIQIGAHSVVGAAACVVRDVPSSVTVIGVPARLATPAQFKPKD